jgi:hypothetical protein
MSRRRQQQWGRCHQYEYRIDGCAQFRRVALIGCRNRVAPVTAGIIFCFFGVILIALLQLGSRRGRRW